MLQPYNGYLFDNTEELFKRIEELARNKEQIAKLADYIKSTRSYSFESEWENVFRKLRLLPN